MNSKHLNLMSFILYLNYLPSFNVYRENTINDVSIKIHLHLGGSFGKYNFH